MFGFFLKKEKNHISLGSCYAVLRGDYYGEIFVFFKQQDCTLYFVSLPSMEIRKVDIIKFDIGIRDRVLDFVNMIPKDVFKVLKNHGKNTLKSK
jgi:hypothetical protein